MTETRALTWLCALIAVLALVAAGVGVFTTGNGAPATFSSVHGETVPLYGEGLYRHDSLIAGSGSRGVDVVTLALAIPLLAATAVLHRRGSMRGSLLLVGVLTYFAYLYTSRAIDTIYNELYLIYIPLYSASLFALLLALRSVPAASLAPLVDRLPRGAVAAFLFVFSVLLILIWLPLVLVPMIEARPPEVVEHYTTFITGVLDLGILLPVALIGAVLVLRRRAAGYLFAAPLIGFTTLLGPLLVAMTIGNLTAGVEMTTADLAIFVVSFIGLSAFAAAVLFALLRRIPARRTGGLA